MPSKNIVKNYVEGGYYHVYNRGVEKREIFLDPQDCLVFIHYIKMYLSPVNELRDMDNPGIRINRFIPLNLSEQIDLLSFSLMPNHIHLQVKQHSKDGIIKFMRRLSTSYVMYFNKKYDRVGALFQNAYKAALIESDSYNLHLSRYIHLNPSNVKSSIGFMNFSSYDYYLGRKKANWIKPEEILSYFSSKMKGSKYINSYKSFVEDYERNSDEILGTLTLEDDPH